MKVFCVFTAYLLQRRKVEIRIPVFMPDVSFNIIYYKLITKKFECKLFFILSVVILNYAGCRYAREGFQWQCTESVSYGNPLT